MSRAENLTKYTCDICGKNEYVKKDDAAPMQEYRLPPEISTSIETWHESASV